MATARAASARHFSTAPPAPGWRVPRASPSVPRLWGTIPAKAVRPIRNNETLASESAAKAIPDGHPVDVLLKENKALSVVVEETRSAPGPQQVPPRPKSCVQ